MNLVYLIVLLPLISSIICSVCIVLAEQKKAEIISSSLLFITAVLSIFCYINLDSYNGEYLIYNWLNIREIKINFAILYDPLTAIMFIVVNVVSALVHIFSIGYMHDDNRRSRFFCYLSLFTFAMLMLVSSNNFIQLFLGWEGVGLCSYLLVGYYFYKPSANSAAVKAFLVNRVGDFGYLIAIALIYKYFNSLDFKDVFENSAALSKDYFNFFGKDINVITVITLFLFMAAVGKSAQIGLHVWLPDAMEGPTPVSALIHAATMVTAGVFLVTRCSPLFELAPFTLHFVTVVGLITSVFAATVALVQDDIKKIIAYSTCSQLGYMFFACGMSAYSLGIFHLVTHAFFKALLFLSAGSVIHCCHHEQNINKMGGLIKKLPYTYSFLIIGSLALAGFPPLSGYFSKDLILEYAFSMHNSKGILIYIIGCMGAVMTAVYSFRLVCIAFHGKTKIKLHEFNQLRDSPKVMMFPLFVLAIGAIFSGYFFYNIVYSNQFWMDSIYFKDNINFVDQAHHIPLLFKLIPIFLVVFFSCFISYCFLKVNNFSFSINKYFAKPIEIFKNKWYFDHVYSFLFVKKLLQLSNFLWHKIDVDLIDGKGPLGIASKINTTSTYFRKFQSGKVFNYAIVMFLGIIIFASILFINY